MLGEKSSTGKAEVEVHLCEEMLQTSWKIRDVCAEEHCCQRGG